MAWKEIKYNSFIFSIFSGLPDTFAEYIDLDIIFEYQRLLLEMHSESDVTWRDAQHHQDTECSQSQKYES